MLINLDFVQATPRKMCYCMYIAIVDQGKCTGAVFLDLTKACDTVEIIRSCIYKLN